MQGEIQILVLRRIEGIGRQLPFPQVQPTHRPGVTGSGGHAHHHRHTGAVELGNQPRGRGLGDKHHGVAARCQALLAERDAVFIDAVDQRQIPAPRQQEAQLAHRCGPEGVQGGAGHGDKGQQVQQPEHKNPRPRGDQAAAGDGGELVDAEKHTHNRQWSAHHSLSQIPGQLHVARPVEDEPAQDGNHQKERGELGIERGLER